jgi:membrane protein DedA with SNARE-associated domain
MVPGLRSVVSIPAGMLRMPLGRFALPTAAGAALLDVLLLDLGRCLGSNWRHVTAIGRSASTVVLAVAFVALAGLASWWWHRRACTYEPVVQASSS